jgi:hypothetical protein
MITAKPEAEATSTPRRPSPYDQETIDLVVDRVFPKIVDWLKQEEDPFEYPPYYVEAYNKRGEEVPQEVKDEYRQKEVDSIKKALGKAFKSAGPYGDGYEIAKELERDYFEGNRELVDILDDVSHYFYEENRKIVTQWAKEHNPEQRFNVGDTAYISKERYFGGNVNWSPRFDEDNPGIVKKVNPETAEYTIQTKQQEEKERKFKLGTSSECSSGYIVKFENAFTEEEYQSITNESK